MKNFSKPAKVKLLDEATEYFEELDEKIQIKFLKSFEKVESGYKGEWFKNLEDGIWEFKERDSQKFYRVFAFWVPTQKEETLIVGTHGINKKSNKTPRKEIEKAKRFRDTYFNQIKKKK